MTKTCNKCGETKPLEEFYKHPGNADGHKGYCKECQKEKAKAYYEANKERHAATVKAWYESNKERHAAAARAWYQANKERKAAAVKAWREANKERIAAVDKAWRGDNPDKVREYVARQREKWPEKFAARWAVMYAIRSGTLVRQPCEVCGNPDVHGHHDNYSKPLVVRWLCPKHHTECHYLT